MILPPLPTIITKLNPIPRGTQKSFFDQKFYLDSQFFWLKNSIGQRIFWTYVFFGPNIFFRPKIFFWQNFFFGHNIFFGLKIFLDQKFFWPTNFLTKYLFCPNFFSDQKTFLTKNIFQLEYFSTKIFHQIFFVHGFFQLRHCAP